MKKLSTLNAFIIFMSLYGVAYWYMTRPEKARMPSSKPSFDGNASGLTKTVVVPTLDTPIPEGKSAIWCATINIAWEDACKAVGHDTTVASASEACARLNAAKGFAGEIPEEYYVAIGGRSKDAKAKVAAEIARKFPGERTPLLDRPSAAPFLGYAFLKATAKFPHPYVGWRNAVVFTAESGDIEKILGFGFDGHDDDPRGLLAKQAAVLFDTNPRLQPERGPREFAIDLDTKSKPLQIVLASLTRQLTLAEAVAAFEANLAKTPDEHLSRNPAQLFVPEMNWRLLRDYIEVLDPGSPLIDARQSIDFRLNQFGYELRSEARVDSKKADFAAAYLFDHSYLLFIKKRGAKRPFFAMWVANAELLEKT